MDGPSRLWLSAGSIPFQPVYAVGMNGPSRPPYFPISLLSLQWLLGIAFGSWVWRRNTNDRQWVSQHTQLSILQKNSALITGWCGSVSWPTTHTCGWHKWNMWHSCGRQSRAKVTLQMIPSAHKQLYSNTVQWYRKPTLKSENLSWLTTETSVKVCCYTLCRVYL